MFAFNRFLKHQVKQVIQHATENVYNIDNLLDMKNGQMPVPGDDTRHLIRAH